MDNCVILTSCKLQLTDRVGWVKFGQAMVNYKAGGIWLKALISYLIAFGIFTIGNLGGRLVFIFRRFKLDFINSFFYSIIVAGVLIPMFFLQKGTPWNTIQFFYYSLFFSGILAGIVLSRTSRLIQFFIIIVTIPTTIISLNSIYLPTRPPSYLPQDEMAALNFLKTQPKGIVLTYPFDSEKSNEAESNPPRALYLYTSTAYVSAFSGKESFLADEINLDITGYDWKTRLDEETRWYGEKDQEKARDFLRLNNIKYIYWLKPQRALLGESQLGIKQIFENKTVYIYEVE